MPALAARLHDAVPCLAVDRMHRVAEPLEESRAVVRLSTRMAGTFATLALLPSMIGIYGLAASDVSARWRELAVRLALGASRRVGIGPGLASLLHGVDPSDAPTLAFAPVVLVAMGVVAAALAARKVLRADPAATLRNE